jgi:two-component system response regulator FlrC
LFEQANGGTLFLDEIGEMPLHLQSKLLRVLQERLLTRLGSEREVAVDVRIIAATNKDLRQAITAREFREDLYFRISTFKLRVPPLRERPGDILPLVSQLLVRHAKDTQFTLSLAAQKQLLTYLWPGNVRELENVVQRALVLCPDGQIDTMHLMFDDGTENSVLSNMSAHTPIQSNLFVQEFQNTETFTHTSPAFVKAENNVGLTESNTNYLPSNNPAANLQEAVKSSEHQMILAAIQTTDSRMEAAAKLGISPRTLRYKLAQMRTREMSEGASA